MTQGADVEERRVATTPFWRSLGQSLLAHSGLGRTLFHASAFRTRGTQPPPMDPLHCDTPVLRNAEISAVYNSQRIAGDFYEFLRVSPSRMLFALLDIAGSRADTRQALIAVQKTFRSLAPPLFRGDDFNETTAMIELCYEMNRTIMRGGLRNCPAFIGCYNEDLGTVCYANAGHTPGMLRDATGITLLSATGLPLGLFSHTTQSAAACHLLPGAALLLVSRGLVETERDGEDFGIEGAKQCFRSSGAATAHDLCVNMLQAAHDFSVAAPIHNDLTTLALVRYASFDHV